MARDSSAEQAFRQLLWQAVVDALDDRRDLRHEIVAEVIEDVALTEDVRPGWESARAPWAEVVAALDGTALRSRRERELVSLRPEGRDARGASRHRRNLPDG